MTEMSDSIYTWDWAYNLRRAARVACLTRPVNKAEAEQFTPVAALSKTSPGYVTRPCQR